MTNIAQIIDGKAIAAKLNEETAQKVSDFSCLYGHAPGLAVILVGDHPASQLYVRNKAKMAKKLGINSQIHSLPAETDQTSVIDLIQSLNHDETVHGILIQLPLPKQINPLAIQAATAPEKDVDGLHPVNIGKRILGERALTACTPVGCMILIHSFLSDITGKKAVVIGRSQIVGQPMADLLLRDNATVTICHSKTQNLAQECRQADILVTGVGSPHLVKGDWIKPGAIVIDVGITRLENGSLTGDVDFQAAASVASAITPVPGGVGPMTIACLMRNTIQAAETQK